MRLPLVALAPFALGVVAGCATPGTPAATPLENTLWSLVELDGRPITGQGPRAAHLRFRFTRDSALVAGATGCNRLTGSFTRDGAALRFGQTSTTRMACVEPQLNQQEQAFLAALQATEHYAIAGNTLTLVGPTGPLARLQAMTILR